MRDRHNFRNDPNWQRHLQHRQRDRAFFGIAIAIIGVVMLFRAMGFFYLDYQQLWPIGMIVLGLLIGIRSGFRRISWLILCVIGAANLISPFEIMGHPARHFAWPALLIIVGIFIAIRPRRRLPFQNNGGLISNTDTLVSDDDKIDIDVTFGGRKEIVTSKSFKGGVITTTFGGCEVNLMQADTAEELITLDIKVAFGGVELMIPSHWELRNEINPSFGNVEDERSFQSPPATDRKITLLLKGSCSFGSVEIKSF